LAQNYVISLQKFAAVDWFK